MNNLSSVGSVGYASINAAIDPAINPASLTLGARVKRLGDQVESIRDHLRGDQDGARENYELKNLDAILECFRQTHEICLEVQSKLHLLGDTEKQAASGRNIDISAPGTSIFLAACYVADRLIEIDHYLSGQVPDEVDLPEDDSIVDHILHRIVRSEKLIERIKSALSELI